MYAIENFYYYPLDMGTSQFLPLKTYKATELRARAERLPY
jgi:hypothetical protein